MSDIPRAREILHDILEEDMSDAVRVRIMLALSLMTREKYTRKAPRSSRRVTPQLALSIKLFAENNPEMPLQDISNIYGVNAGRVSEILSGKKHDN
jgi:hypothetical protein